MQIFSKYTTYYTSFIFCCVSLIFLSCDKVVIPIESSDGSDQIFSVNQIDAYTDYSGVTVNVSGNKKFEDDSSLTINYTHFDSSLTNSVFTIEKFYLQLTHKLTADSTLDYGVIEFGDAQLIRASDAFGKWVYWNYTAELINHERNSLFETWTSSCSLLQSVFITIHNSPDLKDTSQLINTQIPLKVVNSRVDSLTVSSDNLLLAFNRNLSAGTEMIIGSKSTQIYYKFTLLRTSSNLTIPSKYLQGIRGDSTRVLCRIVVEENIFLGDLSTVQFNGQKEFHLPIYQSNVYSTAIILR